MGGFNADNLFATTSTITAAGSPRISKVVTEKFDEEGRVIERTTTEYVYTPVGYTINNGGQVTNLREAPPAPHEVRITR